MAAAPAEASEAGGQSVFDWCAEQRRLLRLEREAERQQRELADRAKGLAGLQADGLAVTRLRLGQASRAGAAAAEPGGR